MKVHAIKDSESVFEKTFRTKYIGYIKGTTSTECTELRFLAFNYDGQGSAIVEEINYKKTNGLFGTDEFSRKIKILTALEVKAVMENEEYVVSSDF